MMKANFWVRSMANAGTTKPAALGCIGDQAREFRQRVLFGMHAVSVSRFHHYDIGGFALHWSGMYDLARNGSLIANAANVPSKEHLTALTIYLQRDFRHARSQDVGGGSETEGQFRGEPNRFADLHRLEILQRILRLFKRVQRQGRGVLGLSGLVIEIRIFFLQVAGVGQDDSTEIDRGRRSVDGSAKALFDEARNPAAVIEVGVREEDRINLPARNRRFTPISLAPFLGALEEATVNEELKTLLPAGITGVDQVLRTGDRPGSTQELYVRQFCPRELINLPRSPVLGSNRS